EYRAISNLKKSDDHFPLVCQSYVGLLGKKAPYQFSQEHRATHFDLKINSPLAKLENQGQHKHYAFEICPFPIVSVIDEKPYSCNTRGKSVIISGHAYGF